MKKSPDSCAFPTAVWARGACAGSPGTGGGSGSFGGGTAVFNAIFGPSIPGVLVLARASHSGMLSDE